MASVDNGVIVRSDSSFLEVKPKCPYCGHVEGDWSHVHMAKPQNEHHTPFDWHRCSQCQKEFKITAYYG